VTSTPNLLPAIRYNGTVWTAPASDGTNGQALTTNAAGQLGWTSFDASGAAATVQINLNNLTSSLGSAAYQATSAFQAPIILTTTGTSGNASFAANTLNIPNYTYTLPTASTSVLGGVKVDGTTISINTGVISVSNSAPMLFSALTSATNTQAAMVVGSGSSISTSGTGTVSATAINGAALSGLSTGILKNTTTTGVPSIAVAGTDYIAPYTSQTQNTFLASPNGSSGTPSFRAIVQADMPLSLADQMYFFGDGSDGSATISSGTTTLTRDMSYSNLTISGSGVLNTAGFRVFVAGTLDISAAGAGAITCNATSAGGTGGATGAAGSTGNRGGNGNTITTSATVSPATGTTTVGNTVGTVSAAAWMSGQSGASGNGGSGSSGSGGSGYTPGASSAAFARRRWTDTFFGPGSTITAGYPRIGGGGGGGDGTNSGGGGGGGGGYGEMIYLSAQAIARGSNATAAIIQAKGLAGGAGGSPTLGNTGGGGGGTGGSGGWVFIAYWTITGSTITNAIDVSSGAGGAGGNGHGTGNGGTGGGSGGSGRVTLINMGAGTSTDSGVTNGSAGGANSGATGGTGATAVTLQVSL
jgi:hypothetical protein